MTIAVLGNGRMGHSLASRLLDTGHSVVVWDRTPARSRELVERGAEEADTPGEAARRAEAVLSSLSDDAAVMDVLAPKGDPLVSSSGPPVIDTSTVAPQTTRRLTDIYGGHFVAAPILGGPQAVLAGEAAYAVAGPKTVVDGLEPLWTSLTSRLLRCGEDAARAQVVKLASNNLLMGGIVMMSEAVVAAQAEGLEDGFIADVFRQLPTVAAALLNRLDDIIAGDHEGWFSTAYGADDVRLFVEMAADDGVQLPVARLVQDRYEQAAGRGLADADIAAVVELLRS